MASYPHRLHAQLIDQWQALERQADQQTVLVALSGGMDSMALLHALAALRESLGIRLAAAHIHHGLSPHADAWAAHCQTWCHAWNVPLRIVRVTLTQRKKLGVEAAAREVRYQALFQAAAQEQAVLAVAHHADDQIETMLLQLLRGTGLAGMLGMPSIRCEPVESSQAHAPTTVDLWRPFLQCSRADIEHYRIENDLSVVQDESNQETSYMRNALRLKVLPVVSEYFPAYRETVQRFAGLAQEAQSLLDEVTTSDFQALKEIDVSGRESLCLERWQALPEVRQRFVLRTWLCAQGLRAPTQAWLRQLQNQLRHARPEATIQVTHQGRHIRRYRDRILLEPLAQIEPDPAAKERYPFVWQGQACLAFPQLGGQLVFHPTPDIGVAATVLRSLSCAIGWRSGGERLRLDPQRPRRMLKNLYQELAIAPWQRQRLPLVWADGHLLFAAGLGMDARFLSQEGGDRYRMEWVASTTVE